MNSSLPRAPRGVATIELALVLMLLSTLVFGTIELGRALHHYNVLAKSVRTTARYLSTNPPTEAESWVAWKETGECLAVYGQPRCDANATPLLPGLMRSQVRIVDPYTFTSARSIQSGAGTLDLLSISIEGYQFRSVVSFVVPNIVFGRISAVMPQG